jgi:hypothetical protein
MPVRPLPGGLDFRGLCPAVQPEHAGQRHWRHEGVGQVAGCAGVRRCTARPSGSPRSWGRVALGWQVGVFALALLLCARLPKVRLDTDGPMVGAA